AAGTQDAHALAGLDGQRGALQRRGVALVGAVHAEDVTYCDDVGHERLPRILPAVPSHVASASAARPAALHRMSSAAGSTVTSGGAPTARAATARIVATASRASTTAMTAPAHTPSALAITASRRSWARTARGLAP